MGSDLSTPRTPAVDPCEDAVCYPVDEFACTEEYKQMIEEDLEEVFVLKKTEMDELREGLDKLLRIDAEIKEKNDEILEVSQQQKIVDNTRLQNIASSYGRGDEDVFVVSNVHGSSAEEGRTQQQCLTVRPRFYDEDTGEWKFDELKYTPCVVGGTSDVISQSFSQTKDGELFPKGRAGISDYDDECIFTRGSGFSHQLLVKSNCSKFNFDWISNKTTPCVGYDLSATYGYKKLTGEVYKGTRDANRTYESMFRHVSHRTEIDPAELFYEKSDESAKKMVKPPKKCIMHRSVPTYGYDDPRSSQYQKRGWGSNPDCVVQSCTNLGLKVDKVTDTHQICKNDAGKRVCSILRHDTCPAGYFSGKISMIDVNKEGVRNYEVRYDESVDPEWKNKRRGQTFRGEVRGNFKGNPDPQSLKLGARVEANGYFYEPAEAFVSRWEEEELDREKAGRWGHSCVKKVHVRTKQIWTSQTRRERVDRENREKNERLWENDDPEIRCFTHIKPTDGRMYSDCMEHDSGAPVMSCLEYLNRKQEMDVPQMAKIESQTRAPLEASAGMSQSCSKNFELLYTKPFPKYDSLSTDFCYDTQKGSRSTGRHVPKYNEHGHWVKEVRRVAGRDTVVYKNTETQREMETCDCGHEECPHEGRCSNDGVKETLDEMNDPSWLVPDTYLKPENNCEVARNVVTKYNPEPPKTDWKGRPIVAHSRADLHSVKEKAAEEWKAYVGQMEVDIHSDLYCRDGGPDGRGRNDALSLERGFRVCPEGFTCKSGTCDGTHSEEKWEEIRKTWNP